VPLPVIQGRKRSKRKWRRTFCNLQAVALEDLGDQMSDDNPWLSVWVRPRDAIRSIIARNTNRSLWILAFIYGFTSLLNCFQSIPIALHLGIIPMLLISVILAPFWGYAFFAIWSGIVVWVGKLLKGQATFETARAAYAWSAVPLIGNIPLWLLLIFFYSHFLFFGMQDQIALPGAAMLLFIILIGKLVFAIWTIVIYLQMLSEVQQFSILRAIVNVILASLIIGIATAFIWSLVIFVYASTFTPSVAMDWHNAKWIVQHFK